MIKVEITGTKADLVADGTRREVCKEELTATNVIRDMLANHLECSRALATTMIIESLTESLSITE